MKIMELFRQLSYGELSNLSISDSGSGLIVVDRQPQLVHYANDGLLSLHARFMLSEKDLLVEQVEHITNYHLVRKFTESAGSDVEWPYIKDLPEEPFEEDLIRILSVHRADGYKFPLNDSDDYNSLFTPQPNILQVPTPRDGEPLSIVYQAGHYKLDDRPGHILDQEIYLPIYLENALQLYVAHKVFSHMNGQENMIKSQEYLMAYEADCLGIEQRDLVNQTFHTSHRKLEQRGFV